ncbi:MAG: Gp15 family bacteriophage protein [Ruthenibacterium lactatiformans]
MSAWNLPVAVSVCGKEFVIRSDFRAVLDALAVLDDAQLTPPERQFACMRILYPDWREISDWRRRSVLRCNSWCGKPVPENQPPKPKLVDWERTWKSLLPQSCSSRIFVPTLRVSALVGIRWSIQQYRPWALRGSHDHTQQAGKGKPLESTKRNSSGASDR